MEEKRKINKVFLYIYAFITMIAIASALTASTYAWFSNNKTVDTNRITARTAVDDVNLELSPTGGVGFNGSDVISMVQVNNADKAFLMPVSTADLKTFMYNGVTVDDLASKFVVLDHEDYIYHGRIYMRASSAGTVGGQLLVYLDQSSEAGGILVEADDNKLLNAARLGLMFNSDPSTAVIMKLSSDKSPASDRIYNTVVDGNVISEDKVIVPDGNGVKAIDDPSVMLTDYVISFDNQVANVPNKPLLVMNLNEIYTVDVYFYLEGCDPDCSDSVELDTSKLHLGFYGIMNY